MMAIQNSLEENKFSPARDATSSVNSEAVMDKFLGTLNLYRKPVAKDGSCLFRAVAEHVYNTQEKHLDVRKECISYMKKNADLFSGFVPGSYEHHLFGLQNPKEWAGQVEIVALSLLYHHDFLIYQEINQPPNCVTDNGYDRKIMLCFSNGNHYDCVYTKDFEQDSAFVQSLLYEYIYQIVLPECKSREELRAEKDTVDGNKSSWIDIKANAGKSGKEGAGITGDNEIVALWEIDRSLDTNVYRNVALEVWEKSKLEQTQADRVLAMKIQFKIGDYCLALVGDSSSKQYLKAEIKDMIEEQYAVYVPELKETFYVFLECLKPLISEKNTVEKSDELTYDKLPGYYRKPDEPPKDFQYPKKRQKGNRGNRDEDGRTKKADGRSDGRADTRNEMAHTGSQPRRERRDRRRGQGGDRTRNDRSEKWGNDRKARSTEKGENKVGDSERNGMAVKLEGASTPKADMTERSESIEAKPNENDGTLGSSAKTDEMTKKKTAKPDETAADFWHRMRKPEPLTAQMASSKQGTMSDIKANNSQVADHSNSGKDAKTSSQALSKKPIDNDMKSKENTFGAKSRKNIETDSGRSDPKHGRKSQASKPTSSNHAKQKERRDSGTELRETQNTNTFEENSHVVPETSESMSVSSKLNYSSRTEAGLTTQPGQSNIRVPSNGSTDTKSVDKPLALLTNETDARPYASVTARNILSSPVMDSYPGCQETKDNLVDMKEVASNTFQNSYEQNINNLSKMNISVHSETLDSSDNSESELCASVNFVSADPITSESDDTVVAQNSELRATSESPDNLLGAKDTARPVGPVSHGSDDMFPSSGSDEMLVPSGLVLRGSSKSISREEKENVYETAEQRKTEQKAEQQRIRILTKGNENQFEASPLPNDSSSTNIEKIPDAESRKSQPKKVSFGNVEFSQSSKEIGSIPPEERLSDQDVTENHYPDYSQPGNGEPVNNERLMYANYNAAAGMHQPYVPMMVSPMMHGNEPLQLAQKFSMDPEGRDLPQHIPTLQYFYNLGLQYFSIQRQQFSLMQMSQMQGNPPMIHPHPIPVQPPSQTQVIHGFAEPTDVSPPVHNIHNDQPEGFIPASTAVNAQIEMPIAMKPQPQNQHQQRYFHNQNHQSSVNQYEQPPRMRRGRGRGSSLGPQIQMQRNYNMSKPQHQEQQLRVEKRSVPASIGIQGAPPPYFP